MITFIFLTLSVVNAYSNILTLPHNSDFWRPSEKSQAFENIAGKGENVGNQYFLLLTLCFLPYYDG